MTPVQRIEVVAAVICNQRGEFLLGQRPSGKVYAGYWEFPGGKVEPGESAPHALARELNEELGIDVVTCYPWLTRDFDYAHAAVRLRFFRVLKWSGELRAKEHRELAWQVSEALTVAPLLPANGPILRGLKLPAVYGISCASALGHDLYLQKLQQALQAGLRLIQVREKNLAAPELRALVKEILALAQRFNALVLVNGSEAVVKESAAHGIHLTAAQLMAARERPPYEWCGASCHNAAELTRARELGVDFVVLGPVNATPTHPDAHLLGWGRLTQLIENYPLPVYALGGMRAADLEQAWRCGAHGIAMVRGAWALD